MPVPLGNDAIADGAGLYPAHGVERAGGRASEIPVEDDGIDHWVPDDEWIEQWREGVCDAYRRLSGARWAASDVQPVTTMGHAKHVDTRSSKRKEDEIIRIDR